MPEKPAASVRRARVATWSQVVARVMTSNSTGVFLCRDAGECGPLAVLPDAFRVFSTLAVGGEDVVLRHHDRRAGMPAIAAASFGRERAGGSVVVELGEPQPALLANRLLSLVMNSTSFSVSGTLTSNGASRFFFFVHSILTIAAPSGKGWPLRGMPALQAAIMVGLATITFISSLVSLVATTAQSSHPLNSDMARPPGTCTVSLSAALRARPPRTASATLPLSARREESLVMVHSFIRRGRAR